MKLGDLLSAVNAVRITPPTVDAEGAWRDRDVGSLHYRAQETRPNGLFVAVPGLKADGHDFIDQAIANGAGVLVVQRPVPATGAVVVEVPDTRRALALLADRFYGHPSQRLFVIGITGTNGKTTTAYLVENLLAQAGFQTGVIGTVNCRYAGRVFDNPTTTPESLDVQRILADMVAAGVTHVVMEVSSHGIDLARILGCHLDIAVFTNLSQDHLDYHGTMEAYWASKQRLFTEHLCAGPKRAHACAVVNCDDPRGRQLTERLAVPCITTGRTGRRDVGAEDARIELDGIRARIRTPAGTFDLRSSLAGAHNLENMLNAVGVGIAAGVALPVIAAGIQATASVPGRLEAVPNTAGRYVYVDYAHTPDALLNVLTALRALTTARLVCVFGCGGDRDRTKRPTMGRIAGELSDLAVITSDNPRTEDPLAIIAQIEPGIAAVRPHAYRPADLRQGFAHAGYVIEADRRKAIRLGIAASRPGDTVLIAGKGHETYQIVGNRRVAFDDRQEARQALAELEKASSSA